MANYTIEVSTLLERGYPFALNSYPIFNEDYREYLNNKILRHYYFYEIGAETPDRFNYYLETKMNEIMPYYNQMYESELLKYNPLVTDYSEEKIFRDTANEKESADQTGQQMAETTGDRYSGVTSGNNDTDFSSTQTVSGTNKDNITETIDSHSTTENDLHTETDTTSDGTGSTNTNGSRYEVFSDLPQNQLNISTTINGDSGGATYQVDGYATTTTGENSVQHSETETHEEGTSTSSNTGTVDVDGNSTRTQTGSGENTSETTQTQKTGLATRQTDDNERNINRNSATFGSKISTGRELENESTIRYLTGRSGQSPSRLLQELRSTFLNIDMDIIEELKPLFMGVF